MFAADAGIYIYLYSPKNREKNNTKTIKSERKIEPNNLTKDQDLQTFTKTIYSSINQLISNNN